MLRLSKSVDFGTISAPLEMKNNEYSLKRERIMFKVKVRSN